VFKILSCSKRAPHDWKSCPFAHPGERGRRRPLEVRRPRADGRAGALTAPTRARPVPRIAPWIHNSTQPPPRPASPRAARSPPGPHPPQRVAYDAVMCGHIRRGEACPDGDACTMVRGEERG
jgi:hypothetical protein